MQGITDLYLRYSIFLMCTFKVHHTRVVWASANVARHRWPMHSDEYKGPFKYAITQKSHQLMHSSLVVFLKNLLLT